jgi:DeoR/GlpR family transcriptional regulator of sugar metabolism
MVELADLQASERRERIAQLVADRQMVRVAALVSDFGVTDTSIRRDLAILESEGRLRRVHGGALAVPRDIRAGWYNEKARHHLAEKQRIGAAAAELITPGDILVFDSGTTTLQVASNIPAPLRTGGMLTLITNSFPLVEMVRSWPAPNLIFLGGLWLPDYQATVGPQALEQLRTITADKVFLGADGLTLAEGITTAHILMAEIDRSMAERARHVILTADSSKLDRAGLVPIVPIHMIHTMITDTGAPPDTVAAIRDQGVEVILA